MLDRFPPTQLKTVRARIAITSTPATYTHYEKNRNHSFAVGEPRSAHVRSVKFIVKRTGCTESYRILPVSRRALSRGRRQDSPDTASARGVEPRWAARGIIPTSAAFASARAIVSTLASVLATRPLSSRRRSGRRRLPASLPSVFLSRALVLWLQVAWWRALRGWLARSQPHVSSPKRPRGPSFGERFATKDPRICPSDQNIPKQPTPFLPQPK